MDNFKKMEILASRALISIFESTICHDNEILCCMSTFPKGVSPEYEIRYIINGVCEK